MKQYCIVCSTCCICNKAVLCCMYRKKLTKNQKITEKPSQMPPKMLIFTTVYFSKCDEKSVTKIRDWLIPSVQQRDFQWGYTIENAPNGRIS